MKLLLIRTGFRVMSMFFKGIWKFLKFSGLWWSIGMYLLWLNILQKQPVISIFLDVPYLVLLFGGQIYISLQNILRYSKKDPSLKLYQCFLTEKSLMPHLKLMKTNSSLKKGEHDNV